MSGQSKGNTFKAIFGPGLLFAATSVGVSHIIQSTRAGAEFGLGILLTVLLVNVIKYPAFQFGTQYSLSTGTTLLQGYRNIGKWAVLSFLIVNLLVMPVVFAALSLATSGVIIVVTGTSLSTAILSPLLLLSCVALLQFGGYAILEKVVKILVILFTGLTFIATGNALMAPGVFSSFTAFPTNVSLPSLFFIVAFVGWMPTGLEASVWQSTWTLKKARQKPDAVGRGQFRLDFNIGYVGTTLLAFCFIILGTALMHNTGDQFPASAPAFIAQVIKLYSSSIGEWCVPLIGLCTFAVLFSTVITVIDGFPRALMTATERLWQDEAPWQQDHQQKGMLYLCFMIGGCIGAYLLVMFWTASFKMFIDFATTVSFVFAPVLAYLNHRAMHSIEVPVEDRPKGVVNMVSLVAIVVLTLFASYYFYLKAIN
ncbi:hypothetical protein [Paremcibacter congregatus]|uniref:NRAMP family divalent metal transporter n=1 Tax=Paremcibacter congregatus TaxID=2043170 RepID=UPI0030EB33C0